VLGQEGMGSWEERGEWALWEVGLVSLTLWSGQGCSCRLGKGDNPWLGRRRAHEQVNVVPWHNIRYIKQWKECLKKSEYL